MSRSRTLILALAFVTLASPVFAQGNPTGTITGHVTDPDSLALPGVTVTVASPVLQGVRTVVTSPNGDRGTSSCCSSACSRQACPSST